MGKFWNNNKKIFKKIYNWEFWQSEWKAPK